MTDYESQYREVARLQSEEIERLRALVSQRDVELDGLVSWIAGDEDALAILRSVYIDPRTSVPNKVRAASSALPFERSKPASVTVIADFRGRVENARSRTIELRKSEWRQAEQPPLDLSGPTPPTILGGDHEGEALGPDPAA
jgi:hypothetical protein